MAEATAKQISDTPFKKIWKNGVTKRERKIIKRALRKELKRLKPDTQKWRDVRTVLACMGEEHHSASELEGETR
jgi:hypothetical protein